MISRPAALARHAAGHALAFVATVAGASAFVLLLLEAAPGDPIDLLPNGEDVRSVLEQEWGLDQPLVWRWLQFLARACTGDLGTSLAYRPGAPVLDVIAGPALRSSAYFFSAMALCMGVGTALGTLTAGRARWLNPFVSVLSLPPLFLLAHLCVNALNGLAWRAIQAGAIERPDWFALPDQASLLRTSLAIALLAVGSGALSDVHGQVEEVLTDVRSSAYVDHARARGKPVLPHILANLVAPLAGIATSRAAFFAGGLVVLEKVLLLNGVGAILWQAAQLRDYNVALGVTLLMATLVAGVRLIGDVVRTIADPRLRRTR